MMVEAKTEKKAPVKPPLACPFLSNTHYEIPCMQERCTIFNRKIGKCGIVDLAITLHRIEEILFRSLRERP